MTHDGMWQDSGRYEWPLLQAPGEQTTAPATQTVLQPYQCQSLVLNWYDRLPDGPGVSSADIVLTAHPDLVRADQEIAALKAENCDLLIAHAELTRRLNELRARVAELEQARDGRTL